MERLPSRGSRFLMSRLGQPSELSDSNPITYSGRLVVLSFYGRFR
jgi:hypothetical protein